MAPWDPDLPVYSLNQTTAALNSAAEAVSELLNPDGIETEDTIAVDDTLNLVVNLVGYVLAHPEASVDEAIASCYTSVTVDEEDLNEGEAMPEKGSARWNELVVKQVKGWIS